MLWIKAFHIIFVIFWMAGLLYLYRLFVYHAKEEVTVVKERFETMERRLLLGITTPAAFFSLLFGLHLFARDPSYYLEAGWFHLKITLVLFLLFLSLFAFSVRSKLSRGPSPYPPILLRVLNEMISVCVIAIVLAAVLK